MASYKIGLTTTNWTSIDGIWYDTASALFYADSDLQTEIGRVDPATRELYRFDGWFNSGATTRYIDENGDFTEELRTLCAARSTTFTIYAKGTQVSYKLTISDNGGSEGEGALYFPIGGGAGCFYRDYLCEGEIVRSVTKPTYSEKIFKGYYNGTSTPGAQYFDNKGNATDSLSSLVLTGSNKTISANWQTPVTITVSSQNGTGGTSSFYRDTINGRWGSDKNFTNIISRISVPTRECYRLNGLYNSDGTTQFVSNDGTIDQSWSPSSNTTIYCKWTLVSYKISVSKQSGTGGLSAFYIKKDVSPYEVYHDYLCAGEILDKIDLPKRTGYSLTGLFSSSSGGTKYVNRDGSFDQAFYSISLSNKTFYAQWKIVYTIALSRNGGTGGTSEVYYDRVGNHYYSDKDLTVLASSVSVPSKECYSFDGYFLNGTKYVESDGTFTTSLASLNPTGNKTFTAQWSLVSYKATLDANGGSGGAQAIYFRTTSPHETWYGDDSAETEVSSIEPPTRPGYSFLGYYTANTGGSLYVESDGRIRISPSALTGDTKFYARWSANTYTITFDYSGGTGQTQSKTVTYDQPIGTLPTGTRSDAAFGGWSINGTKITSTTKYRFPENSTAVVVWILYFGNLTDWFGLSGNILELVSSESGESRQVTNLWNGAVSSGNGLLNPVCTYRIKSSGNVSLTLGHAIESYMIVEAEYQTGADKEPLLVVKGVANEGADAINLYAVAFSVNPDHIAQDPFNAVSGGGELVELKSAAVCDPVVPYENNAPCASDVVHGRKTVSGRTAAYFGEVAPTFRNDFVDRGVPKSEIDVDFTVHSFSAERMI